jgi:GNAT superfamily N-acetyltransferase
MISFRPYTPADRNWVSEAHLQHYCGGEGFDSSFAGVLGKALDGLEHQISNPRSQFLVAHDGLVTLGCIFLSPEGAQNTRIRLFYLDKACRGQGLGLGLLRRVVGHARETGAERVLVSTFDRHRAACQLYGAFGFQSRIGEPTEYFGHVMRQIDFTLDLAASASPVA